jgi:hypothetical protein
MSDKCMLAEGPFYQCCCNCRNHWQDFHHCTIHTTLRAEREQCVCGVPKGWVCIGFRAKGDPRAPIHSEWPEHSVGCEMYSAIRHIERPADINSEGA